MYEKFDKTHGESLYSWNLVNASLYSWNLVNAGKILHNPLHNRHKSPDMQDSSFQSCKFTFSQVDIIQCHFSFE